MGEANFYYFTCLKPINIKLSRKHITVTLSFEIMTGSKSSLMKSLPIGPKQLESLKLYRRSAILFGVGGSILACYALEWKAVLRLLPYYNGKYEDSEDK